MESPLDPNYNGVMSNIPQDYQHNILDEIKRIVREELDDMYGDNNRGVLKRTGELFWIGTVNVYDGEIEEVHSYEEARNDDFHHSYYFSQPQIEKMTNGEVMIFWIAPHGIEAEWTMGKAGPEIINKIKQQIVIRDEK
jgi:hypothetical protein